MLQILYRDSIRRGLCKEPVMEGYAVLYVGIVMKILLRLMLFFIL
jgi:hypothetical protein